METAHRYQLLAFVLGYPGPGTAAEAAECSAALRPHSSGAAARVERLATFAASADPRALEELYARTFDFTPARTLDLGFQLFGETYKRGMFLVKMQEALRVYGIDGGRELPDHLPSLLRLLAVLPPGPARELADEVLLPATSKLLAAFEGEENPYRAALEAVVALLQADFAITEILPIPEEQAPLLPPGMVPLRVRGAQETAS